MSRDSLFLILNRLAATFVTSISFVSGVVFFYAAFVDGVFWYIRLLSLGLYIFFGVFTTLGLVGPDTGYFGKRPVWYKE